ncbi:contact-dependent growth inhibition system immunity protein [Photorhabdus antumapuensis]|uniref:contact-dependent growth inhibition system immunity protein n=1 Tax=Photorhabdus antumapuensis TaxID=2862867 RepID=UPI001CED7141|nr:contact-dependent growth inhibition system immunity protein [Photorhabdus antumapuensis]MCA6219838.1 CdiI family contact-dependent growth inhibition immunity protein [Photorhabdus antumapuensis]
MHIINYSDYRALHLNPLEDNHILSPDITNSQLGSAVLDSLYKSRLVDPDNDFFDNEKTSERYEEWIKDEKE